MKYTTKNFYNNITAKTLKCLEELVIAIAAVHNIIRAGGGGNTNLSVPPFKHSVQISIFAHLPVLAA
jgi:hypothetical protein